jgi:hypothetical protein
MLLALASAVILGSEFRGTVSDSRLLPPGGSGPRIYILQEQGGPVIPLFDASYDSQGYGGVIQTRLHPKRFSEY